MAFQSAEHLAMAVLGIVGNQPPDRLQPPLADGIHLRWVPNPEQGFPWHGYYLFVREHQDGERICVIHTVGAVASSHHGTLRSGTELTLPQGTFSSDADLSLTELFSLPSVPELALENRSFLRFDLPPETFASSFQVRIGFLKTEDASGGERRCIDFRRQPPATRNAPFTFVQARFEGLSSSGELQRHLTISDRFRLTGLTVKDSTRVTLPTIANQVEILLSRTPGRHTQIEAYDEKGNVVAERSFRATDNVRRTRVSLKGEGIASLTVSIKGGLAALHRLCYWTPALRPQFKEAEIELSAFYEDTLVHEQTVQGRPGDVVEATVGADALTALELSGGPAVLIELCYDRIEVRGDWQTVEGFEYPMCLPVQHPAYPCNGNRLTDEVTSRAKGRGRIAYGDPANWSNRDFHDLHDRLLNLVQLGPGGPSMHLLVEQNVAAQSWPGSTPDPGSPSPTLSEIRHIDWILLSTLHPAIAQMVGLYFIDRAAIAGRSYDYIVLADHLNLFQHDPQRAIGWLNGTPDFTHTDAWISSNISLAPDVPIAAPQDSRAFAIPGATRRRHDGLGDVIDATNNVGLRWRLPSTTAVFQPDSPVMYYLWRANLGLPADAPAESPADAAYGLAKKRPFIVTDLADVPPAGSIPTDWPPEPLHAIDSGLAEGWYAYRLTGITIFGQHTLRSDPAEWWQWEPVPEPRPWYYTDPAIAQVVHPFAVALLDKVPPPPPTAIEAWVLDPNDPNLLQDPAYNDWRSALPAAAGNSLVGLRVRWRWTLPLMRQAPDAHEFRLYWRPERFNQRRGHTVSVTVVGATESRVVTDMSNNAAANAFTGATLQVGGEAFRIVASEAGDPLAVQVANIGPNDDVAPAERRVCTVVIPAGLTALHEDASDRESWQERFHVTAINQAVAQGFQSNLDGDENPLAGSAATAVGNTITLDAGTDLDVVRPGTDWLYLAADSGQQVYLILAKNPATSSVEVNGQPALGPGRSAWQIGYPFDQYEMFLPAANGPFDDVLGEPTLASPLLVAQIGISTTDDKNHTADSASWAAGNWGNRTGNEGAVGGPVEVFRVRRVPPLPPPVPPPDSDRVYATPADYHSDSYYTYRWVPADHLNTHLFRAIDEALFEEDWFHQPRSALSHADRAYFPDEAIEPLWDQLKRTTVAYELNVLATFPKTASGKRQGMRAYRELSNDGLRILANLPGNDRAFQQLTIAPLHPSDPAHADRRGPDNPTNYQANAGLRAWIDRLDGRSANRYLYKAAYIDEVHNRGPLSQSSVPVWLPNVVSPRAPSISKVSSGDQQITLAWASNREPDLATYRIFRSTHKADAVDIRLMQVVSNLAVPPGDPAARPGKVLWTDQGVPASTTFYYRVVAIDDAGNVSQPSRAVAARAFSSARPAPPAWHPAILDPASGVATLSWVPPAQTRVLVQRRIDGLNRWDNLSNWLPVNTAQFTDDGRLDGVQYHYRLRVLDQSGRGNDAFDELTV